MIADILKAIAWPIVTLILGGSLIWILRKKLPAISERVSVLKLNKGGLEANLVVAAASLQLEAKPPETGLSDTVPSIPSELISPELTPELAQRLNEVRNLHVPPIVLEQERLIRSDIERLKIGQAEAVDLLIKHLAVTQLSLRAETVYRTIFGSQIALLKIVNMIGTRTRTQLLEFYEETKIKFPALYCSYTFEQYLHYLTSQGLLFEQSVGQYVISVAGKEFLKWLAEIGAGENKLF
jgi:hypothetical protein